MADFWAYVQPYGSGANDVYLHLFFVEMGFPFNSSYYESVGICTSSFNDGDSYVSDVKWEYTAPPSGGNNYLYQRIDLAENGIFSVTSTPDIINIYPFAKSDGAYYNFKGGYAICIRKNVVDITVTSETSATVKFFLPTMWRPDNYTKAALLTLNIDDGTSSDIIGAPAAEATDITSAFYVEIELTGLTQGVDYTYIPYIMLPNGSWYHFLPDGQTITVNTSSYYEPSEQITTPSLFDIYDAGYDYFGITFLGGWLNNSFYVRLCKYLESGGWQEVFSDTINCAHLSQEQDGDPDCQFVFEDISRYNPNEYSETSNYINVDASAVYKLTIYAYRGDLKSKSATFYVTTAPRIDSFKAEGASGYVSLSWSGTYSHRQEYEISYGVTKIYYDYAAENTSDYIPFINYDNKISDTYSTCTAVLTTDYISPLGQITSYDNVIAETRVSAKASLKDLPERFQWETCCDADGHKVTTEDAVLSAEEWNRVMQCINAARVYGGDGLVTQQAAYRGDEFTAEMYNQAVEAIKSMTFGVYGTWLSNAVKGQAIEASDHLNALMDEYNAVVTGLSAAGE